MPVTKVLYHIQCIAFLSFDFVSCLPPAPIVFASLSFIGLWSVHPVVPDPSDPQTYTNTVFTKCPSISSSEPEEAVIWKEASSSCLDSLFVGAVNSLKDVPAVFCH